IYIDEVIAGLLALAMDSLPRRNDGLDATFVLAGPETLTFGNWLRLLRRAHTGKRILFLPIPLSAALLVCDFSHFVPFFPKVDRERVLGLAGTEPMDSANDLEALHVEIVAPMQRLTSPRSQRKRVIAEAIAMLSYVSGNRTLPRAAVARLVRGIE